MAGGPLLPLGKSKRLGTDGREQGLQLPPVRVVGRGGIDQPGKGRKLSLDRAIAGPGLVKPRQKELGIGPAVAADGRAAGTSERDIEGLPSSSCRTANRDKGSLGPRQLLLECRTLGVGKSS